MKKRVSSRTKKPAKKISKKSSAKIKATKRLRKSQGNGSSDILDKILLAMRQRPYSKLLTQIEVGKKRLSEERKLALELGLRVLSKAREVRDSIMSSSKSTRR